MKLHYSLNELKEIRNPVVTTGTFDGVHVGHKTILRRLKKLAKDINGETLLITFHPHPRRVLYPNSEGKELLMILSQKEKIELLEKTGLDHLLIIPFTKEFSNISSHDFVEDILVGVLHTRIVVVGFNHQFGHRREGNFEYLYGLSHIHGFEVEEIPEQDIQNETVSSTKIRKALLTGNIQRANAYLDHYYIIKGKLIYNEKNSGFLAQTIYSMGIEEDIKLVPPDGIYAVNVENEKFISKGMLIVSDWRIINNVLNPRIKLDVTIFKVDENLDGKEVTLYFQKKIRDSSKTEGQEQIRKQMRKDQKEIEELIF
jgi:riboflavin kinase / FMN adenylyltransferase